MSSFVPSGFFFLSPKFWHSELSISRSSLLCLSFSSLFSWLPPKMMLPKTGPFWTFRAFATSWEVRSLKWVLCVFFFCTQSETVFSPLNELRNCSIPQTDRNAVKKEVTSLGEQITQWWNLRRNSTQEQQQQQQPQKNTVSGVDFASQIAVFLCQTTRRLTTTLSASLPGSGNSELRSLSSV